MNKVKLHHHFAVSSVMEDILRNITSIDEFLANSRKIGAIANTQITEPDPEDPLRERNRIVGDSFEVFGEFLLKHKRDDDRVLISKYGIPLCDNGIDGEGVHPQIKGDKNSGVSVFVQFKCYQEFDHTTGKPVRLIGKQLDTFQAECMHVLRERFPDGRIIPGWPRMLVITSAMGMNSYTQQTKYRGLVECFGIEELRQLTVSPDFWDAFRTALGM
jgi:hypothetical protein